MESLLSCPWQGLSQKFPPNVTWCEAHQCSWIMTPANTWSNLAYILAGVFMIWDFKKNPSGSQWLRLFPGITILLGCLSGIYHASLNQFSQALDFFGMLALALYLLLMNLVRLNAWPKSKPLLSLSFAIFIMLAPVLWGIVKGSPIQAIILTLAFGVGVTELQAQAESRKYFVLALGLFVVGSLASLADITRYWCFPQSLLQAHALWHLLSAGGVYGIYQHYRQFSRSLP